MINVIEIVTLAFAFIFYAVLFAKQHIAYRGTADSNTLDQHSETASIIGGRTAGSPDAAVTGGKKSQAPAHPHTT